MAAVDNLADSVTGEYNLGQQLVTTMRMDIEQQVNIKFG